MRGLWTGQGSSAAPRGSGPEPPAPGRRSRRAGSPRRSQSQASWSCERLTTGRARSLPPGLQSPGWTPPRFRIVCPGRGGEKMAERYELVIRGGVCVLPWGEEATDVGVREGRIAALGVQAGADAGEVIDAAGLHVLPGLIDPHVHLRDPGDKAVESIPPGTRAAVLGGLATVFDMPNTLPSITDADRLAWKQGYVESESWCDIGLYVGGTKQNIA